MQHAFEGHVLGATNLPLEVGTREELQVATLTLLQQTRRTIEILSRELDPAIYDAADVVEAIKRMILANRYARVRAIVAEPQKIAQRGHRLVELAYVLSSFIELRTAAEQHRAFIEALLICDGCGYTYRQNWDRFDATVNFSDRRRSNLLQNQFEEMWALAEPDPNLRRLAL
jgi:hypothetical protein